MVKDETLQVTFQLDLRPGEHLLWVGAPGRRRILWYSFRRAWTWGLLLILGWDLYLLDVAAALRAPGDSAVRHLVNTGRRDVLPAWSSGGDWIAFVGADGEAMRHIQLVHPDGTDLQSLVADIDEAGVLDEVQLSWSLDDQVLVYNDRSIHAVWLDHAGHLDDKRSWQFAAGHSPALAPNGWWLAYAAQDGIYVLNLDSGETVNVTQRHRGGAEIDGGYASPAWSPAGDRLAYVHEGDLFLMEVQAEQSNVRGARPIWLTRGRDPAWSPDGMRIAFAAENVSSWDLQLISAAPVPRWPLRVQQVLGLLLLGGALVVLWRARSTRKAARADTT